MTTAHSMPFDHWQHPRDAFEPQWSYSHRHQSIHSHGLGLNQPLMDEFVPSQLFHGSQHYHPSMGRPHHYQSALTPELQSYYNNQHFAPFLHRPYAASTVPHGAQFPQPYQQTGPFTPYPYPARQPQMMADVRPAPINKASKSCCSNCNTPLTPSPSTSFHSSQASGMPSSPALPRGPPRKPKRSGHAVWVGNIPIGVSIDALKDHFARDATTDIESVFLMAKSNCAFVNYKTEEACNSAVERFSHSLFGSVRLLCRLRQDSGSSEASSSPAKSNPSSQQSGSVTSEADVPSEDLSAVSDKLSGLGISRDEAMTPSEESDELPPALPFNRPDRYFIVKSLTKEDLQDSLLKGTWVTQPHNQTILDEAFRNAENVYLVFSVNKSGEYFGYARMISSPFDRNPSPRMPSSSYDGSTPTTSFEGLQVTKTIATATAPKGSIVNDVARGTIFWETEHGFNDIVSSSLRAPGEPIEIRDHAGSRPFQVEWLSVKRVGFSRTKGLRNPWNANKEVKVARDGTELETNLGKKLGALFHERYEDSVGKS